MAFSNSNLIGRTELISQNHSTAHKTEHTLSCPQRAIINISDEKIF